MYANTYVPHDFQILPVCIARPWHAVSQHLGLKPIITYAAVELYNYKLLDPEGPYDLSNLSVMHTFTGNDEAWFYLISVAVEAVGATALKAIINAMEAVNAENCADLAKNLDIIATVIDKCTEILARMFEKNDPHIFYHRVRQYVAGWENSSELPSGLFYEGVGPEYDTSSDPADQLPSPFISTDIASTDTEGSYRKYAGASAGQSSLFHCLDIALGVEHRPTLPTSSSGDSPSTNMPTSCSAGFGNAGRSVNHIHQMRRYMPGEHRDFIYALSRGPSIRKYISNLNAVHPDPPMYQSLSDATQHSDDLITRAQKAGCPAHIKHTSLASDLKEKKGTTHCWKLNIENGEELPSLLPVQRKSEPHSQRVEVLVVSKDTEVFKIDSIADPVDSTDSEEEPDTEERDAAVDARAALTAYNRCVEGMRRFRDRHIQIVSVYIVAQASKRSSCMSGQDANKAQKDVRAKEVMLLLMRVLSQCSSDLGFRESWNLDI